MAEIPVERLPARRHGRGPHPTGGAALRAFVLGERERISRRSRVRELVLGFQDGLLVPLAVVTGLAGADVASETVLVGGLAEAAAGAVAMGSGAYLASQAENQLFRNEIEDEEHELADTRPARDALPLHEYELTKRRSARWVRPTPMTARRQPLDWNLNHPRITVAGTTPPPHRCAR